MLPSNQPLKLKQSVGLLSDKRYPYFSTTGKGEDIVLHSWLPVASGTGIGLDNTCKTLLELREFVDRQGQRSILKVIERFQQDIQADLKLLNLISDEKKESHSKNNEIITQTIKEKETLAKALQDYLIVIRNLFETMPSIDQGYYPQPILDTLYNQRHPEGNLASIALSPKIPGVITGVPIQRKDYKLGEIKEQKSSSSSSYPLFSLERENIEGFGSALREALSEQEWETLKKRKKNDKEELFLVKVVEAYQAQYPGVEFITITNFNTLKEIVQNTVTQQGLDCSTDQVLSARQRTKEGIFQAWLVICGETETTQKLPLGLAVQCWMYNLGTADAFNRLETNPFPFHVVEDSEEDDKEQLSIQIQFLLAMINAHCASRYNVSTNFGYVLDTNELLRKKCIDTVMAELETTSGDLINVMVGFINSNLRVFDLKQKLNEDDQLKISDLFCKNFNTIKKSQHYDEFLLLLERQGSARSVMNRISLHLCSLLLSAPQEKEEYKVGNLKKLLATQPPHMDLKKPDASPYTVKWQGTKTTLDVMITLPAGEELKQPEIDTVADQLLRSVGNKP